MAKPIPVIRGGVFVPKWGNAGRKKEDQIRLHYHFLSGAEQMALTHYEDAGKTMAYSAREIAAMVDRVENLSFQAEGEEENVIENGADLVAEPGAEELMLEFWDWVRQRSPVDKKKSRSGSASSSEGTPADASTS